MSSWLLQQTTSGHLGEVADVLAQTSAFVSEHYPHGHAWRPDPMIWDDQALVLNVRDRGLVIISGVRTWA